MGELGHSLKEEQGERIRHPQKEIALLIRGAKNRSSIAGGEESLLHRLEKKEK